MRITKKGFIVISYLFTFTLGVLTHDWLVGKQMWEYHQAIAEEEIQSMEKGLAAEHDMLCSRVSSKAPSHTHIVGSPTLSTSLSRKHMEVKPGEMYGTNTR